MTWIRTQRAGWHNSRAFTMIELLAVVGIISVLMSLLLPTLSRARDRARTVQCAVNMRTVTLAILGYVAERHRFPPNVTFPSPGQYWYDDGRAGGYIPADLRRVGGALSCPSDPDARRSYAMNAWVSSALDAWIVQANPSFGSLWGSAPPARAMLLIESWSGFGSLTDGYVAVAAAGFYGTSPGPRFGGGGGLTPFYAGRRGNVTSEIDFTRHGPFTKAGNAARELGLANIAYADGHVETTRPTDLYDARDGRSTLEGWWSPADREQNSK